MSSVIRLAPFLLLCAYVGGLVFLLRRGRKAAKKRNVFMQLAGMSLGIALLALLIGVGLLVNQYHQAAQGIVALAVSAAFFAITFFLQRFVSRRDAAHSAEGFAPTR